ncbi:MAG: vitamin B12 dependent-methionine synthase activation domain-containing protein [bacterium]
MSQIVPFNLADIMPAREAVLQHQGIPRGATIQNATYKLLTTAVELFRVSAQPIGLISELSLKEFETVFKGQGENADASPLVHIFPQAENLALFAVTMGGKISAKIEALFKDNDFALGAMLDAVASLAADKAVAVFEDYFYEALSKRKSISVNFCVLSYSPGYCGWHISGQKKLFHFLQPQRIGISLNDSFLMTPLKSVTGVLIGGKKEIHIFENDYPFCSFCKTYSCRVRMKSVLMAESPNP